MTLPNFLIIGTGRSGTTSLYHYLRQHPQVFMSRIKETNFFAFEGNPDPQLFPIQSLRAYEALFSAATGHRAIGEASPLYFVRPTAADRIKQQIPHARLILIVRNPAERAYACHLDAVRRGTERRSLAEALHAYRNGGRDGSSFDDGFYSGNLRRYLDRFGRDQLAVHLYEDFASAPGATVRRIFRFLDVDDGFVPDTSMRHNPSGLPRRKMLELVVRPTDFKRNLKARMPYRLRQPLMAIGNAINRRNMVKPALPQELRHELIALYREDILKLQDLIERDLTPWLTAAG